MVYTTNADVLYRRKKNPFPANGKRHSRNSFGYGYLPNGGIGSLLKGLYSTPLKKSSVKRKAASLSGVLSKRTKKGVETSEGANSLTKCNFGTLKCYVPKPVLDSCAKQINVRNLAGQGETTVGLQDLLNFQFADPATIYGMINTNDKMILHTIKGEITLVNSSSSNSSLVIYDIISKRDASSANVASAGQAWIYGVDSAGGTATDYKVIGSEPTESVAFNEFYKIYQRTRISLAPGQMHRHEVYYAPNKVLSGQYMANTAYEMAGISLTCLVVHHGMPAHDSTTKTDVRINLSTLDYMLKVSYDWRQLDDSTTSWTKSNTLATSFAVGEEFVNESVGQVQNSGGLFPGTLHT